jgi:hypothetical protein
MKPKPKKIMHNPPLQLTQAAWHSDIIEDYGFELRQGVRFLYISGLHTSEVYVE